jgi:23S rRNA (pseudouridine1915-N3)-methyltransferase
LLRTAKIDSRKKIAQAVNAMFQFKIIQIGETRDKNLAALINEYIKRLTGRAKIEIVSIKDFTRGEVKNDSDRNIIKEKEAAKILEKIDDGAFVIALDERGREFTSVDFAGFLEKKKDQGIGHFTLIIGGCYGLSQKITAKAQMTMALSKLTFTHELSRLILFEQLFRAVSIITGRDYHY